MKKYYTAVCATESLPLIREFANRELIGMDVEVEIVNQIVLALDEACANSIIHQHHSDGVSQIRIGLNKTGNILVIEIEDQGEPFPIDQYEPTDLQQIIETGTRGGLGISLINKIMDKVEVIRSGDKFSYRFTKILGF